MNHLLSGGAGVRALRATVAALATAIVFAFSTLHAQQMNPSYFADCSGDRSDRRAPGTSRRPRASPAIRRPTTRACRRAACGRRPTAARPGSRSSTTCTSRRSAPSRSRRPIRRSCTSAPAISPAGRSRPAKASTSRPTPARPGRTSGSPRSQYIGGIVVDPRNADNVLVAALGPRRRAARGPRRSRHRRDRPPMSERGVYRSTDGGRTWTRVLPTDGSSGASDVYLDYRDPQIVYALLGWRLQARQRALGHRRLQVHRRRRDVAAGQRPRTAGRRAHSPPSRSLRARTAGGCTRSPAAAAGRGGGGGARPLSIRRRRRLAGRSARGSSRAPAARCTRIRRIPTSCT